jgi:hypothetical protein
LKKILLSMFMYMSMSKLALELGAWVAHT